ncbi:hypothetical protein EG68_05500 [Paragonimus skrjabini miyazakii]|uniref:SH2 domain-containing protein n=1 Tax=Paragonimus skrjabini miyazakii TaxID=59628 RepID=A0A8S9YZD5_9TREM|nr:hypothetical protein EG68_05500 [Paragonimus skrjabini miyazakii]
MNGERLRYPVPPCAPPVEFHKQRLRAVQSFEPETASDRLGCSVDDRFLLVSGDQNTDWVFVTSVKTRQSGYLPKCCVEKEYPELIERLEFFHPDATSSQSKELLKKAGAYSYLLRPCDSKPGLYTLLFYDGTRVRKYRLELHVHSEELPGGHYQKEAHMEDVFGGVNHRRSSEPIGSSTYKSDETRGGIIGQEHIPVIEVSRHRSGEAIVPDRQDSLVPLSLSSQYPMVSVFPRYRTVTRVMYNGLPFPSVEAVVAAILAHPGPWHPESLPDVDPPNGAAVLLEEKRRALPDFDEQSHSPHIQNTEGDLTRPTGVVQHAFKPIRRERKPQLAPPSSTIYMALRYTRQPINHSSVLEIHGEISMLISQRKKWKSYYAQLDGKQGILTLRDIDKRKFERFDLSRSDYFPVHHLMYDRPFCFGLLLHGSSVGDREELVFSVDPPSSPCSLCFPSTTSTTNNVGASNYSTARPQHSSSSCDLDPSTYAGRFDDADVSPTTSFAHSSGSHQTFDPSVRLSPTHSTMGFGTDTSGTACSHRQIVSMDTVFARWQRFIRLHCRNTRVDSANEENFDRRQTLLRCYRTLDVKIHNAKLLPANWCKSRRDESTFWIMIDGVEIARAYAGSSTVSILIDDFPYGFKKVELYAREENKRKRFVALEVDLSQLNSDTSLLSDSSACGIQRLEFDKDPHAVGSNLSSKSSICHIREGCCAQGTITYKELHVLPFTCYERFREVIRTCLDSEFVPLCIYTWKNLQNELSNKPNFVSSLLLTTTELRCHLQLIVHLLESDIMPDNPICDANVLVYTLVNLITAHQLFQLASTVAVKLDN